MVKKSTWICAKCGAENPSSRKFCETCGCSYSESEELLHNKILVRILSSPDTIHNLDSGTKIEFRGDVSGGTKPYHLIEWDFGDIASLKKASGVGPHTVTFTNEDSREKKTKVHLTVKDSKNRFKEAVCDITLNPALKYVPLQSRFKMSPFSSEPIESGTVVTFTDSSIGNPDRWEWDFGSYGKETAKGPHSVKFVNTTSGAVREKLSLRVFDKKGNTDITTCYVIVKPAPISSYKPKAAFNIPPGAIESGTAITFVDSSTGDLVWWDWDFGSSGTRTMKGPHTVTFVNTTSGAVREKLSLRVFDKKGNNDTTECYVTIKPAPAKHHTVKPATPFKAKIQIKGDFYYSSGDSITVKHGTALSFSANPIDSSTTYHWEGGNSDDPRSIIREGIGPHSIRFLSTNDYESFAYLTLNVSHADGRRSSEKLPIRIINKEIRKKEADPKATRVDLEKTARRHARRGESHGRFSGFIIYFVPILIVSTVVFLLYVIFGGIFR